LSFSDTLVAFGALVAPGGGDEHRRVAVLRWWF
jgi:hypothetical protein